MLLMLHGCLVWAQRTSLFRTHTYKALLLSELPYSIIKVYLFLLGLTVLFGTLLNLPALQHHCGNNKPTK